MTKAEQIKIGVAGGCLALALLVIVWYLFLSGGGETKLDAPPEGTPPPKKIRGMVPTAAGMDQIC